MACQPRLIKLCEVLAPASEGYRAAKCGFISSAQNSCQYREYLKVSDKQKVDVLLPHHCYDYPIDLQPGTEVSFGRTYSLSEPKCKSLEYLVENLQKGFIHPFNFPSGGTYLLPG